MKPKRVTALKRRATEIIAEPADSDERVRITQHGKPAAYLMGVDDYEALNHHVALLEGIARGENAVLDGRIVDHDTAKQRISLWLSQLEQNPPSPTWMRSPTNESLTQK